MTSPEMLHEINERPPSTIMRIAYHQLYIMCGITDPTVSTDVVPVIAETDGSMMCIRRILNLPIFASLTSAFRTAYAVTKDSHETVTSILNRAEDGMRAGLDLAKPITSTIGGVLETPLKTVDNAVCVGLDFVEERIPSVTESSYQSYVTVKQGIRSIFTSMVGTFWLLFGESKKQIEDSSNEITHEKIQKVSS